MTRLLRTLSTSCTKEHIRLTESEGRRRHEGSETWEMHEKEEWGGNRGQQKKTKDILKPQTRFVIVLPVTKTDIHPDLKLFP